MTWVLQLVFLVLLHTKATFGAMAASSSQSESPLDVLQIMFPDASSDVLQGAASWLENNLGVASSEDLSAVQEFPVGGDDNPVPKALANDQNLGVDIKALLERFFLHKTNVPHDVVKARVASSFSQNVEDDSILQTLIVRFPDSNFHVLQTAANWLYDELGVFWAEELLGVVDVNVNVKLQLAGAKQLSADAKRTLELFFDSLDINTIRRLGTDPHSHLQSSSFPSSSSSSPTTTTTDYHNDTTGAATTTTQHHFAPSSTTTPYHHPSTSTTTTTTGATTTTTHYHHFDPFSTTSPYHHHHPSTSTTTTTTRATTTTTHYHHHHFATTTWHLPMTTASWQPQVTTVTTSGMLGANHPGSKLCANPAAFKANRVTRYDCLGLTQQTCQGLNFEWDSGGQGGAGSCQVKFSARLGNSMDDGSELISACEKDKGGTISAGSQTTCGMMSTFYATFTYPDGCTAPVPQLNGQSYAIIFGVLRDGGCCGTSADACASASPTFQLCPTPTDFQPDFVQTVDCHGVDPNKCTDPTGGSLEWDKGAGMCKVKATSTSSNVLEQCSKALGGTPVGTPITCLYYMNMMFAGVASDPASCIRSNTRNPTVSNSVYADYLAQSGCCMSGKSCCTDSTCDGSAPGGKGMPEQMPGFTLQQGSACEGSESFITLSDALESCHYQEGCSGVHNLGCNMEQSGGVYTLCRESPLTCCQQDCVYRKDSHTSSTAA